MEEGRFDEITELRRLRQVNRERERREKLGEEKLDINAISEQVFDHLFEYDFKRAGAKGLVVSGHYWLNYSSNGINGWVLETLKCTGDFRYKLSLAARKFERKELLSGLKDVAEKKGFRVFIFTGRLSAQDRPMRVGEEVPTISFNWA